MHEFREQCINYECVFLRLLKSKEKLTKPSSDYSDLLDDEVNGNEVENGDNEFLDDIYLLDEQEEVVVLDSDEDKHPEDDYSCHKIYHKKKNRRKNLTEEQRKANYQALLSPCDICGKMVDRKRLLGHVNQHNGVKPYACDVEGCEKKFHCPYMLTGHRRDYHSDFVYNCDICGKTYQFRSSYYNHRQKHLEPRFSCSICGHKFKSSSVLKQHARTHTGERPYQCSLCVRAFNSSYNLKAHMRTHTGEKPFVCTHCGVSYSYNSLLKSHMERCHPEITVG